MIQRIHSRNNPKVKDLTRYHDQYLFFEGEKLVRDILERNPGIDLLLVSEKIETRFPIPKKANIKEVWFTSEGVIHKVSHLKEKSDVIAVINREEMAIDLKNTPVVLVLDNIQDPGNLGAICRCAAAFGVDALALTGDTVHLNNSKFLRAAQTAFFDIHFQRFKHLDHLLEEALKLNPSFHVYTTSPHPTTSPLSPKQIEKPALIIIGNEGQGLDGEILEKYPCITIPHDPRVESLNAAISACILMYELFRPF